MESTGMLIDSFSKVSNRFCSPSGFFMIFVLLLYSHGKTCSVLFFLLYLS